MNKLRILFRDKKEYVGKPKGLNRPISPRNLEILRSLREGVSQRELAKKYGVSFQRVHSIAKRYGFKTKEFNKLVKQLNEQN